MTRREFVLPDADGAPFDFDAALPVCPAADLETVAVIISGKSE